MAGTWIILCSSEHPYRTCTPLLLKICVGLKLILKLGVSVYIYYYSSFLSVLKLECNSLECFFFTQNIKDTIEQQPVYHKEQSHYRLCNVQNSNYPFTFTMQLPTVFRSFVTTVSKLKMCDFSGETFKGFGSAIIFYECNDDTTALQRRVLQTVLWHYTC